MGRGLLIIEASRSHSETPHSVGLLWTGDQPDAEMAYRTTLNTHFMAPVEFEPPVPANGYPQKTT